MTPSENGLPLSGVTRDLCENPSHDKVLEDGAIEEK